MATEDNKGQEELLDYEEDEEALVDAKVGDDSAAGKDGAAAGGAGAKKGHYVGIHASGFRDFLLKPELLRAVVDCGFEHPSEVQHECIPQVRLGAARCATCWILVAWVVGTAVDVFLCVGCFFLRAKSAAVKHPSGGSLRRRSGGGHVSPVGSDCGL